jgi:hypothetical protein
VATISGGGQTPWTDTWSFTTDNSTSVGGPFNENISANVFPNPANGYVNIALQMEQSEHVQVEVLTLSGRTVATVFNGGATSGINNLGFDATGWASGVYMVRIQSESHMTIKKLIIE